MRFSQRSARDRCRWLIPLLIAALLILGSLLPHPAAAVPPDRGLASVTDGSAEDVLGQLINRDFSQPDFTHGAANDAVTADSLSTPSGVALDATNHRLFVADNGNHRVLVFDLTAANALADRAADRVLGQADMKGSTANRGGSVAANTLANPWGLAYDSTGNRLFVAEQGNSRVLVYDTATITNGQSAVAVLGQANFTSGDSNRGGAAAANTLSSPRGVAYDAAGQRLFVADYSNSRVLAYDVASITDGEDATGVLGQANFISDGSGLTQATLNGPSGLAYDGTSRLFVADADNNRVLVYDVSTVSNGENATGVLGQADFTSNNTATTQGGLTSPQGLAYASTGSRLFVADQGNHRVLVYDVLAITNGENAANVLGQANFTSSDTNRGTGVAANTLSAPREMAYDSGGDRLLVADASNHRVLVYDVATILDGEAATDLVGQVDASGNAVFTTATSASALVSNRGLNGPRGMAVDTTNHRLFVTDGGNHRVLVYNLDASDRLLDRQPDAVLGQANFSSGSANRGGAIAANTLSSPWWVAYDAAGSRLFVSEQGNNRVLVYDVATISDGENAVNVLGQANFSSGSANRGGAIAANTLSVPVGLAYDAASSRLLVADNGNHRVLVYDVLAITDGEDAVAVLGQADFTSGSANRGGARAANTLSGPNGLAYDSAGQRLFAVDNSNNRVLVYEVAAISNGQNAANVLGQADFTSGGGSAAANTVLSPSGLGYDAASSRLFLADSSNSRVLVYDTTTITNGQNAVAVLGQANFTSGSGNRGGAIAANGLNSPVAAAYNSSAEILYLADTSNNRVLLFNASGPTGTAVSINGGATYAAIITATLALTATGAAQMLVSDSASFTGASYQTYTTTLPWTLSTGDGAKAVYGRFRDSALGVSTAVSDTIILDTTPPAAFSLSSPVSGTITNTASPTLTWEGSSDATSGLAKYQLWVGGVLNRDNVVTTTTSIAPTGTLTEGLHTWMVVAVDNVGNSRDSSSTSSVTVDTTPPAAFSLSSPVSGTITNTGVLTFTWEASSDATSGLAKYQLFVDGALNRDNILTSTLSITPTSVLTDGLHTWMVVAVDNAGNARESSSSTLTVDTVAPTVSGVTVSGVTTSTATITWSSSEAASSQVEYGLTDAYGSATTEADTSTRVISHTVGLSGLTPATTYHYRVKGKDEAGNLGASGDNAFTTAGAIYVPFLAKAASGGW